MVRLSSVFAFCNLFLCSSLTLIAAPQLRLSSTSLGPIYVEAGSNGPAQLINAFNTGDGSLNLVATSSASWLSGSIGQPTMCANGPVAACLPINIALNTAGLAIGTYTEYVTLSDANATDAPQAIPVTVQVDGAPTNTDFYVTPNTGASTAQSATAYLTVNVGGSVISTVTTSDSGKWLNFVLFEGNRVYYNGYQIRVTAQTGQAEGNYTGMVVLSGSVYPSDNNTINVNLHVTSQPIIQFPSSPVTLNLVQGQAAQTYSVNFPNIGLGNLSISGVTVSGGSWLSALPTGGGAVSITANPGSLNPGSYLGSITLVSNAANTGVSVPVRVNVAPPSNPIVFPGGVVDGAAFVNSQSVAAGSVAAVFGTQLSSSGPASAPGFPLPTNLGGVQVLINGNAVPLIYADANQVNIQVPFYFGAGQVLVQVVRNGQPGNRVSLTIDSLAPRLFTLRQLPAAPDGSPYGVVLNSDGTLALPTNFYGNSRPAHRGDIVTIYALGLGPVSPSVNTGDPAPSSEPLARTTTQVQVLFGTGGNAVAATPLYSGLAPTFAGLYQINVVLPVNALSGNLPVSITVPGHNSNAIDMAISSQ